MVLRSPNGEKHVVATYVINRKYEPAIDQCNDFRAFSQTEVIAA